MINSLLIFSEAEEFEGEVSEEESQSQRRILMIITKLNIP